MWTTEQEKFIIDNYGVALPNDIKKAIGKTKSQVQYKVKELRALGLIPQPPDLYPRLCEKYGVENIEFVKTFYPKYGSNFCASKTGLTVRKIQNIIVAIGLRVRGSDANITRDNLYYFDHSLLESPTSEFAYLLGFIWGDGHIRGDRITCANLKEDLESLFPVFFKTGKWSVEPVNNKNSDGCKRKGNICISMHDSQLADFLMRNQYDAKKNSSPDKILSYLPIYLKKYWWRGFFDADGYISFKERPNFSIDRLNFSLASSYEQDWIFAKTLFSDLKIEDYQLYRHVSKKGHKQSAIRASNKISILKFMNYIYDSYDYIGLSRKYMAYLRLANNLINRALRIKSPHQTQINIPSSDWEILNRNFGNMTKALMDDISISVPTLDVRSHP